MQIAGWSTKMLEEVASKLEYEDTEEMIKWRNINQEGVDALWKELRGKLEEELCEKFKLEETEKGPNQERNEQPRW